MIRLTDEQWERIRDHFPEENIADGRPGRKPIPTRCVLEAVLWILNTGAQWHMLPQSYPNYKTVHRRFQTWCRDEVLRRVLTDVANELRDRGALNEEECFIDATFVMAKGGGLEIGSTKRGKGMKIMAIVDRHGLPLSVSMHAANHHEVRLVQLCFRQRRILVRWEYYAQNFLGFVQLACLVVLFRRFQIGSNLSRR